MKHKFLMGAIFSAVAAVTAAYVVTLREEIAENERVMKEAAVSLSKYKKAMKWVKDKRPDVELPDEEVYQDTCDNIYRVLYDYEE